MIAAFSQLGRILKEMQGEHWVRSEYDLLGPCTCMRSSLGAEVDIARKTTWTT